MKKIFSLILFLLPFLSFSQDNSRFANFQEGQVICSSSGKLTQGELYVSKTENDFYVIGVYSPTPNLPKANPVKTEGIADVLVDESTGAIKKGDVLTSGANGKAVRLVGSGFALGVATADSQGGKVTVLIITTYVK